MARRSVDLNLVRVFVAVVEAGGIRKAADLLGIARTSISRQVAELEERLGTRLLHRTTRALALTEPGRALFERSRAPVRALEDASDAVAELGSTVGGLVRLSVPPTMASSYLGAPIAEALARYPALRIEIDASDRHVELMAEGYDLAIRAGKLPDSALTCRKLGEAHWGLWASPSYLGRRGAPRTPQELALHECIIHAAADPASPAVWELMNEGEPLAIEVTGRVACSSLAGVKDAAVRGLGIARLLPFMAAEPPGALVPVLEQYRGAAVPLSVVMLPGVPRPPRVDAVLSILLAHLSPAPWT